MDKIKTSILEFLNNKGFTLLEVSIAAGIGSMLILLSSNVLSKQQALAKTLESQIYDYEYNRTISRKLGNIFEAAGGGLLAPYQAVNVENNCAARSPFPDCLSSDRVSILLTANKADGTSFDSYIID